MQNGACTARQQFLSRAYGCAAFAGNRRGDGQSLRCGSAVSVRSFEGCALVWFGDEVTERLCMSRSALRAAVSLARASWLRHRVGVCVSIHSGFLESWTRWGLDKSEKTHYAGVRLPARASAVGGVERSIP